jgi:hypothetical protein
MNRRTVLGAAVAAVFMMSMSGLGGSDETAPRPADNFPATITDKTQVSTRVEYCACEGTTSLPAERGKAKVSIPFARIGWVEFRDAADGMQQATVHLADGQTHDVRVKGSVRCTGVSDLGDLAIRIGDVRKVVFEARSTKPSAPKPSR